MGWFQGVKLAGSDLPNIFKAGTFYQEGGLMFWDVYHTERAIVVDLDHERYHNLVIEVADPKAVAGLINDAVSAGRT